LAGSRSSRGAGAGSAPPIVNTNIFGLQVGKVFGIDVIAIGRHPIDAVIGPQRFPGFVLVLVLQPRLLVDEGCYRAHERGAAFARQHYTASIRLR
jgi:hypothetical protein